MAAETATRSSAMAAETATRISTTAAGAATSTTEAGTSTRILTTEWSRSRPRQKVAIVPEVGLGEGNPGADPAGAVAVDALVQQLLDLFPPQQGGHAEDGDGRGSRRRPSGSGPRRPGAGLGKRPGARLGLGQPRSLPGRRVPELVLRVEESEENEQVCRLEREVDTVSGWDRAAMPVRKRGSGWG